jgi:ADP-heptose:LPS heptosyltransferase
LPALLALRRRFSEAKIQVAGNPAVLPLLAASGIIDLWVSFDSPHVTYLFRGRTGTCSEFLPCDAGAVAWCADPDGILRHSLERRGAQQPVIASSRPAPARTVHVARHLLETLAPLGIAAGEALELPTIAPPPDALAESRAELAALGLAGRPFVAVHPGSGSRSKNWPAERYAAVLDALARQHDLPSLILAGPADDEVLNRLAAHTRQPLNVLAGRQLTVVAAVLQQARAFLGNDSGLAHLAGQLGLPTLALFGPTDPAVWSPLGPRVRTLRAEPLADLSVESVLAQLLLP